MKTIEEKRGASAIRLVRNEALASVCRTGNIIALLVLPSARLIRVSCPRSANSVEVTLFFFFLGGEMGS